MLPSYELGLPSSQIPKLKIFPPSKTLILLVSSLGLSKMQIQNPGVDYTPTHFSFISSTIVHILQLLLHTIHMRESMFQFNGNFIP
jgi:hypothetical protein